MAQKKSSKKATRKKAVAAPLAEDTAFEADEHTEPQDRNQRLADLLQGPWLALSIVRIDRIEIGSQRGWRVTHRG